MVSQRECHGCKKIVPASDMKYMLKGKSMVAVCPECRTKNAAPADKSMKKEAPQKKTYICAKCKYKFKVSPDQEIFVQCPYCGRSDSVTKYQVLSSEALLKSVEETDDE